MRNDLLSDDRVSDPAPIQSFSSGGDGASYRDRPQRAASAYYQNCSAARAAGAAPVHRGDPGYARRLDRDGDGVGCE
ncbi:excalibur calcium-binding domain-containing protein [Brevundimonas sp.]|uniref:excalibur calcium-binding domain-containing protein n=1 Tax=Brevundimonas sp. TaxID=1871086 RepID=UPI0032C21A02